MKKRLIQVILCVSLLMSGTLLAGGFIPVDDIEDLNIWRLVWNNFPPEIWPEGFGEQFMDCNEDNVICGCDFIAIRWLVGVIPGDANRDGIVNSADLNIVGLNWGATDASWQQGNFNGDGVVDAQDLNIIGENWLEDEPPVRPCGIFPTDVCEVEHCTCTEVFDLDQ